MNLSDLEAGDTEARYKRQRAEWAGMANALRPIEPAPCGWCGGENVHGGHLCAVNHKGERYCLNPNSVCSYDVPDTEPGGFGWLESVLLGLIVAVVLIAVLFPEVRTK